MRVLLVEDHQPLVRVLKQGLEEEGFAVDVAYDGDGTMINSQFLDKYFKDAVTIKEYKTTEEHDLDLANGRLDAIFVSILALNATIEKPDFKNLQVAGPSFGGGLLGSGVGVGLRKADPELKAMFDKAIGDMIADGSLKALASLPIVPHAADTWVLAAVALITIGTLALFVRSSEARARLHARRADVAFAGADPRRRDGEPAALLLHLQLTRELLLLLVDTALDLHFHLLAPFPLRYGCADPTPWGPVTTMPPHATSRTRRSPMAWTC